MAERPGAILAAGLALSFAAGAAAAQRLALPPLLTDHAVIQRDQPIRLDGDAKPGSNVTAVLAGETAEAKADPAGRWRIVLPPHPAGGPYDLTVNVDTGESQTVHDLLLGDVWLCSGQSNMELTVRHTTNADGEMGASADGAIRLIKVPRLNAHAPQRSFRARAAWVSAGPSTVADFSAACFYMGRELKASLKVPIGLIDASWGGSRIQDWISPKGIKAFGGYDRELDVLAQHALDPQGAERRWRDITARWLAPRDPGATAHPAWSSAELDDRDWPRQPHAGFWEGWGVPELATFDGIVWYRSTVTLTADQAAHAADLELGPADDMDTTWVNGVMVGGVEGWDVRRDYAVPAGVLHAGVNSIAVRVLDTGGGGGLWGKLEDRALRLDDGTRVPLSTDWRYRVGPDLSQLGPALHSPWVASSGTTTLYDGLIAPLSGWGLKGVAWYQGEANVAEAGLYARLLPAMFRDWRESFGQDLPFLVVQLASFGAPSSRPERAVWAELRDAERRAVAADPKAALVVSVDIGDRYDIHPSQKVQVGHRLALQALSLAYGQPVASSGPLAVDARREGNRVVVRFSHATGGLVVYGSNRPAGFELCDASGACRYADAEARGEEVVIDARGGPDPARVRFAWSATPIDNLYNKADLPASPFEIEVR